MRGPSLSNASSMACVSSEFCLKQWCTHHDNAFYWLNRILSSRLWHPIIPREFGWRALVTIYVSLWHMIGSPDQMEPPASTRTWNRVWSFTATTGFCFVPFWSRWISAGFSLKISDCWLADKDVKPLTIGRIILPWENYAGFLHDHRFSFRGTSHRDQLATSINITCTAHDLLPWTVLYLLIFLLLSCSPAPGTGNIDPKSDEEGHKQEDKTRPDSKDLVVALTQQLNQSHLDEARRTQTGAHAGIDTTASLVAMASDINNTGNSSSSVWENHAKCIPDNPDKWSTIMVENKNYIIKTRLINQSTYWRIWVLKT